MLIGTVIVDAAVPPPPATVNVQAAAVVGVVGDETGVIVTRSGLGPLAGDTLIPAPGAQA